MAADRDKDFGGKMERSHSMLEQTVSLNHEPLKRREYKRSKTLTSVDWKLLLAFNPPPGYRKRSDLSNPSVSGNDVSDDEREDKVLGILRNILRDLECEIREDKQRLKVGFTEMFVTACNNTKIVFIFKQDNMIIGVTYFGYTFINFCYLSNHFP